MTTNKLLAAILKGLEGAKSSEAERIRESIQWLSSSEKRKLATTVINAVLSNSPHDEEE